MAKLPTPQMLVASRPAFPDKSWLDTKPEFMPGSFCYPAKKETMELLHMPNPHEWDPAAEDWNLPENWEKILCDAFADRLEKHRSLKLFMDICVRCGACADKCHFFLGSTLLLILKGCRFIVSYSGSFWHFFNAFFCVVY